MRTTSPLSCLWKIDDVFIYLLFDTIYTKNKDTYYYRATYAEGSDGSHQQTSHSGKSRLAGAITPVPQPEMN